MTPIQEYDILRVPQNRWRKLVDALVKNTILPFSPYKYETSGQTKKKTKPKQRMFPLGHNNKRNSSPHVDDARDSSTIADR